MAVEIQKEPQTTNTEIPANGDPILNLKTEVAQKYVDNLKNNAGLWASLVIGKGEKLKNFLVTKGDGYSIANTAGLNFMANLLDKLESKTFALDGQQYDIKNYLLRVKTKINMATEDQLNALKINIDTPTTQTNTPTTTPTKAPDTSVVPSSVSYESVNDATNQKAEGTEKYFQILTDSSSVSVKNIEAKQKVESMIASCTFFWEKLSINKYVIPRLEKVEREIKAAGIKYSVNSIWWYNRRNVKWWSSLSYHALWLALDINPAKNPFILTRRPIIHTDMPKEFVDIFKKNWFVRWGDRWDKDRKEWSTYKADAMHFQFADEKYLKEQIAQEKNQKIAA